MRRATRVAVPRVASIATLAHSKSCSYWQLRTSVIGLRTGKRWARKKSKNSTETLGFSARVMSHTARRNASDVISPLAILSLGLLVACVLIFVQFDDGRVHLIEQCAAIFLW